MLHSLKACDPEVNKKIGQVRSQETSPGRKFPARGWLCQEKRVSAGVIRGSAFQRAKWIAIWPGIFTDDMQVTWKNLCKVPVSPASCSQPLRVSGSAAFNWHLSCSQTTKTVLLYLEKSLLCRLNKAFYIRHQKANRSSITEWLGRLAPFLMAHLAWLQTVKTLLNKWKWTLKPAKYFWHSATKTSSKQLQAAAVLYGSLSCHAVDLWLNEPSLELQSQNFDVKNH